MRKSWWQKLWTWVSENDKTIPAETNKNDSIMLITIHGFGRKRSSEMQYIKQWGEQLGWQVVTFDLFDHEIESAPAFDRWIEVAEQKVQQYISEGYDVNLLGFSMGGVIASHLASELAIRRLVLLAPAFDYIGLESARKLLTFSATSVLKDSEQKFIKDLKARVLPPEYFPQFIELVRKYRNSIKQISCPVLFIHGSDDEIVPIRSSRMAYRSIKHEMKKLFVLEGATHQLMLDPSVRWEVFMLIRLFLEEAIVKKENIAYNNEEQIDEED